MVATEYCPAKRPFYPVQCSEMVPRECLLCHCFSLADLCSFLETCVLGFCLKCAWGLNEGEEGERHDGAIILAHG